MILRNHLFKILLIFALGIVFSKYLNVDWVLAFTAWSISIFVLLIFVFFGRQNISFRKPIGISFLIVFFFSGILSFSSSLNSNKRNHYYDFFLPKDKLSGTVIDFQKGDGDYNKVIFEVEYVFNDFSSKHVEGRILCYARNEIQDIDLGSQIVMTPTIQPIENRNNPGEFDAESFWLTQGISEITFLNEGSVKIIQNASFFNTFWRDMRAYFKKVLSDFVIQESYEVASALVLGDKSSLSKESRSIFANAGAMHVLAVSGMHVGILLGFLQWIFYRVPFLRRRNLYIYSSLIVVWCFAFLTGMSASVFRATLMFSVLAVGQLRGYSFFSLNALLFSGFVLLIIDPFYLFNIGFQLSFLAMFGIVFFYGRIRDLLSIENKWLNYFWEGTAIGIAAQIGTVPLSLYYFNQFPNYFIITNLGLLILAAAALVSAILLFIFHMIPFVNELIGKVVDFVFQVLNGFVGWINDLPFSISTGFNPSASHVLMMYLSIIALLYFHSKRKLLNFRVMSLIVFLIATGFIYEREINKESRELIVFNHYSKTLVLKEGLQMFCFFEQREKDQLEKTQFLVEGYKKQMGCEIIYFPVSINKVVSNADVFELTSRYDGWKVDYYKHQYCLINSKYEAENSNIETISGHWDKYVEKKDFSTLYGALIFKP